MFLSNIITPIIKGIAVQPLYEQHKHHMHTLLGHASKACCVGSDLSSEQQWNSFCKIMVLQPVIGDKVSSCFFH